ncbi:hypothetical protein C7W93_11650 [Glaciimonas sp. PCH181]|nr:hypothetical protein C7W93_11650 [Glaciimonas sp. PCH181]
MWAFVANIAGLAGILGISVTNFLTDSLKSWIAVAAFVGVCAYLICQIFIISKKVLSQTHPSGFLPLSSIAKYVTSDGKNLEFETLRHLQIKRPFLRHIDHAFHWTGSKEPKVSSEIQIVQPVKRSQNTTASSVKMIFPRTRIYNDVEVVHIKMLIDDSDEKSETYLSMRVQAPICLISFQVDLLHVTQRYHGESAKFTRSLIENGSAAVIEDIKIIQFSASTKSFFHMVTNPEPGYEYKLWWPRPMLTNGKAAGKRQGVKVQSP